MSPQIEQDDDELPTPHDLHVRRKARYLATYQVANQAKMTATRLYQIENRQGDPPTDAELRAIADAIDNL